ncbi:MAG: hypothetical protein JNJ55_03045 [Betaproteobacteria bacterium]|nr:hypothetical protein [Betaproteobacteria bacterium]
MLESLERLANTGQLKREAPDATEFERMLVMAARRLDDARLESQSLEGRFLAAYHAAHAASLAALRRHGYRSENRYLVFQCLTHTLGWPAAKWRVFDNAHRKRNLAEYEGYLEVEEPQVNELTALVEQLIDDVRNLNDS